MRTAAEADAFTHATTEARGSHWMPVEDIVRGADLLDSTPRQILLQRALGLPTPRYLHLPRLAWLGPAQRPAHASDLLTATTLRPHLAHCDSPQQLAQLQQTADGNWQECARGFVAPGAWVESDMLTLAEV